MHLGSGGERAVVRGVRRRRRRVVRMGRRIAMMDRGGTAGGGVMVVGGIDAVGELSSYVLRAIFGGNYGLIRV